MGEMVDMHDYSGVGLDLRSAREALGKQIADATKTLRIRPAHLEALESGRYADLPGPVYVHGFVRSYAGYLQLDPDEMVRRVQLELQPRETSEDLHFPAPTQNAAKPSSRLLLLALLLAAAVFAIWYLSSGAEDAAVPQSEEAPAETPPPDAAASDLENSGLTAEPPLAEGAPAEISAWPARQPEADATTTTTGPDEPQATDAPQIPPVEELVAQSPAAPEANALAALDIFEIPTPASIADGIGQPQIARGAAPAFQELQETFEGIALAAALSPPRAAAVMTPFLSPASPIPIAPLVLRATSDTWMQVSNANGALIKSWVMREGENYVPPEEAGLNVMVGNAGALIILIDGEIQPSLGAQGAVIRGLPLNPAELKARLER